MTFQGTKRTYQQFARIWILFFVDGIRDFELIWCFQLHYVGHEMSQVLPIKILGEVKVVPAQEICRDTRRANHLANKWILNGCLAIISSKFIQLVNILFRKMAFDLCSQDLMWIRWLDALIGVPAITDLVLVLPSRVHRTHNDLFQGNQLKVPFGLLRHFFLKTQVVVSATVPVPTQSAASQTG